MALIENPPKMSSLTLQSSIAEAWSRPGLQIDVWPLYLDNITGIKNSGNWTTGWSPPSHGLSGSHSFGPPPFFHCFSLSIDQKRPNSNRMYFYAYLLGLDVHYIFSSYNLLGWKVLYILSGFFIELKWSFSWLQLTKWNTSTTNRKKK